ncbi:MAG: hypothetical protein K8T10_04775 [Candidatus Eremiobacteraeota bacterium]|nr:hypothetical protein [Candidatus Eremiobacteraeota bacterium]
MKNLEYWQNHASAIEPGEENLADLIPLPLINAYASDSLEKGVSLIMVGNEKLGMKFIDQCEHFAFRMGSLIDDSRYFLFRMVTQWIRTNRLDDSILQSLLTKRNREIFDDLLRYGQKDIFEIYQHNLSELQADENVLMIKLKASSSKKYAYEAIGMSLIEIAGYYVLLMDHRKIDKTVRVGQHLLEIALKRIPGMLKRRNYRWKNLEKYSDVEIKKMDSKKYQYYLKQRDLLRGQIPFYRKQGEILGDLAKLMRDEVSHQYIKDKFDLFFEQVINPTGKISSELCMIDELLWLIIKQKAYDFIMKRSPRGTSFEYMQKNLG